jgi:hypothetical protein
MVREQKLANKPVLISKNRVPNKLASESAARRISTRCNANGVPQNPVAASNAHSTRMQRVKSDFCRPHTQLRKMPSNTKGALRTASGRFLRASKYDKMLFNCPLRVCLRFQPTRTLCPMSALCRACTANPTDRRGPSFDCKRIGYISGKVRDQVSFSAFRNATTIRLNGHGDSDEAIVHGPAYRGTYRVRRRGRH